MNITHNITPLFATLTLLTACSDDLTSPTYTVGEANNAITLRAGINEGTNGVQTRAIDGNHTPDNTYGGGHKTLTQGTQLRLRVDGTWLGKNDYNLPHGKVTSGAASQTTTATVGGETPTDSKHNNINFENNTLYWDDYGTADPANMPISKGGTVADDSKTDGRTKGLTIYGVAVNDQNLPTTATDGRTALSSLPSDGFNNVAWNVGKVESGTVDQSTSGWESYDLLISNNIRPTDVNNGDGTYKFDDYVAKLANSSHATSDLLEFTHAMSKITFILTAGKGFPVAGTVKKFNETPKVTLTSRVTGDNSTEEWAQTKGTVNVETGAVTLASTPVKASVKLHHAGTDATTQKVTLDALVFPGSAFGDKVSDIYPTIARIEADGNIYYITSEKIREAIAPLITANKHNNEYKTESGKNYIITVTVNKTEIKVTATITDWINVEAGPVEPVINVSADFGNTTGASSVDGFSFYRSTELLKSYGGDKTNEYYPANAIAGKPTDDATKQWPFKDLSSNPIKLYWPSHNTHYQFRGVWPQTSTQTTDIETVPHVKALTDNTQVIDIKNVKYEKDHFPSDLMIARPEFGFNSNGIPNDPECNNADHTKKHLFSEGICATEGLVKMNFRYMMSQVEVRLKTATSGSKQVNLTDAEVEIVNGYINGYVKLGDREAAGNSISNYTLDKLNNGETDRGESPNVISATNIRHSAIVPQSLTSTSGDLQFKITIYNSGKSVNQNDKDVYTATIKDIKVTEPGDANPKNITKWEPGKHYIYLLDINKTEIKVTATLTDWIPVTANQDIWF